MAVKNDPRIERIETRVFQIPTDRPESDGTLAWDSTTMVLVHAWAGGRWGMGYTYADAAVAEVIEHMLAPLVQGRFAMDIPTCWNAMQTAIRNNGNSGLPAMAVAAVDSALWDLKARLLGVPLAALLGMVRPRVPVYGSGGFTSYSKDVVTGSSAGLGRATALAFAREGAAIGLLSRNKERLETLRQEIERLGGKALVLPTDVSDPQQVEDAAQAVETAFGPIDVWINNAMTSVFSEFIQMTTEEFKRVTEVTYLGVVYGTMSALHRMLPRDHGVIVQVGSALAERSIPLQSAYCGAKHAIRGFTDSIRCELNHHKSKVHLTMVQMPALNTPQFDWVKSCLPRKAQPVPPIFQPEVGADAIVWAARHGKREMRVGWPTVKAFWGNKFIAGWLDDYLGQTCYKGQQTNEPADPDRPTDLWQTVPGNFGAHGRFDNRATSHSFQVKLVKFFSELGILRAHPVKYLLGADREVSSENRSRRTKILVAATAGAAAVFCAVGLVRLLGQATGGAHLKEKMGNRPEVGNQRRLLTDQDLIQNEMAQQAEDLEHGWSRGKEMDQEGGVAELEQDKERRRKAA